MARLDPVKQEKLYSTIRDNETSTLCAIAKQFGLSCNDVQRIMQGRDGNQTYSSWLTDNKKVTS